MKTAKDNPQDKNRWSRFGDWLMWAIIAFMVVFPLYLHLTGAKFRYYPDGEPWIKQWPAETTAEKP